LKREAPLQTTLYLGRRDHVTTTPAWPAPLHGLAGMHFPVWKPSQAGRLDEETTVICKSAHGSIAEKDRQS
jgi:hypothetical protein